MLMVRWNTNYKKFNQIIEMHDPLSGVKRLRIMSVDDDSNTVELMD